MRAHSPLEEACGGTDQNLRKLFISLQWLQSIVDNVE
jgi:hypothetical protein